MELLKLPFLQTRLLAPFAVGFLGFPKPVLDSITNRIWEGFDTNHPVKIVAESQKMEMAIGKFFTQLALRTTNGVVNTAIYNIFNPSIAFPEGSNIEIAGKITADLFFLWNAVNGIFLPINTFLDLKNTRSLFHRIVNPPEEQPKPPVKALPEQSIFEQKVIKVSFAIMEQLTTKTLSQKQFENITIAVEFNPELPVALRRLFHEKRLNITDNRDVLLFEKLRERFPEFFVSDYAKRHRVRINWNARNREANKHYQKIAESALTENLIDFIKYIDNFGQDQN